MTRTDPTLITSWDHPIMLPTLPRPIEPTSTSHIHHPSTHPTSSHLHNQTQIQILTQLTQDPTPTHVLVGRHDPTNPTSTHVVVGKHNPSHIDDDDMDDTEPEPEPEPESERDVTDDIDKTHHLNIPRYRSRSFSSASSSSSSSSPQHRDLSPSPRAHQRDDWSHHISSPTHSNLSSQHASSTTSVAVSSSPSPSASPSSFSSRSPSHMLSSRRISSLSSSSHMSSPHSYTSSPLRRHRQLHPISPDILSPCALELGVIAMHHVRPHFPHTPSEPNSPLFESRVISCSAPSSTLIKSRLLSTSSSTSSSSSSSTSTPASPSHASMSSSPLSLKPRYLHSPQQSNSVLAMKQRSNSWSSIASTYAQFFHEYFTRFAEIAMHMVMERSPWSPDAYILDVGAGTGALSLTTARHGYRTCAIDYSPDMIHILNTKRTQQHLSEAILHSIIMDAQAMGFPDSRFDVVFAMFCVMLFPSKTIGLTEMYRVLKPGGYMVMTLWDDEYATEWNVLHTQAMRMVRPDRGFDMITHSHDRDATVALLQSVGYTNVEMTPGVSLTYTVEDPTSFWHALAQVTSTRFLLDTYFTKQQQQRVQHTFISLLQQRGDPETGVIKLTGRATFYIAQKPMNATATIMKDDSSIIASSSTPSSSISLVKIPSPVPSLFPPTCVSPPISVSSSSSSCSSDSPSSSFKLPLPITSTSPAMSCNSSTSSEQDTSTS